MKLSAQAETVRAHLKAETHLTAWQAEGVYHIRRLASRIDELRAAGFEIETETKQDAKGQRYTRYSFSRRQKRAKGPVLPARSVVRQFRLQTIVDAYRDYLVQEVGIYPEEVDADVAGFERFLQSFVKEHK